MILAYSYVGLGMVLHATCLNKQCYTVTLVLPSNLPSQLEILCTGQTYSHKRHCQQLRSLINANVTSHLVMAAAWRCLH